MVWCKSDFVSGTFNAMFSLIVEVLYFPYPLITQKYVRMCIWITISGQPNELLIKVFVVFTVGVDQVETTEMSQTVEMFEFKGFTQ